MPRWTEENCYVDPRAIEVKGRQGLYKCSYCGKLFWYRMYEKKKDTKTVFCSQKCAKESQVGSTNESCYVDPRAIETKGHWGLYKCERCGRLHWHRMCERKKTKHVYCSTKCKKDSMVNYNRPRIDDKIFKQIYYENYNIVQTCAFQVCGGRIEKLQYLEDCMQYGFIELWKTYNRNKMNCGKKYLRKAIKHTILSSIRDWFKSNRKYVCVDFSELEENHSESLRREGWMIRQSFLGSGNYLSEE